MISNDTLPRQVNYILAIKGILSCILEITRIDDEYSLSKQDHPYYCLELHIPLVV